MSFGLVWHFFTMKRISPPPLSPGKGGYSKASWGNKETGSHGGPRGRCCLQQPALLGLPVLCHCYLAGSDVSASLCHFNQHPFSLFPLSHSFNVCKVSASSQFQHIVTWASNSPSQPWLHGLSLCSQCCVCLNCLSHHDFLVDFPKSRNQNDLLCLYVGRASHSSCWAARRLERCPAQLGRQWNSGGMRRQGHTEQCAALGGSWAGAEDEWGVSFPQKVHWVQQAPCWKMMDRFI